MEKIEIDLREQIANEIEVFIRNKSVNYQTEEEQEYIQGLWAAIGVVRAPIWHKTNCPCSLCKASKIMYRGWVVQVLDREEFNTEEEARQFGIDNWNKRRKENPTAEFYFEVDDLGTIEEGK